MGGLIACCSWLLLFALATSTFGGCSDDAQSAGDGAAQRDGSASAGSGGAGAPDDAGGGDAGSRDGSGSAADAAVGSSDGGSSDGGSSDGGSSDAGSPEPCGDGVVGEGESCDTGIARGTGKCPSSCDDAEACTTDILAGAETCEAECSFVAITDAEDGDGCCPAGLTGDGDDDCPPTRLDVSVDPDQLSTELGTTHRLTVTLEASNGFAGDVQLEASVVDGANAPLSTWTVELDDTGLTVAEDGVATAQLTITIPTAREALAATAKVVATSSAMAGTSEASVSLDLLDRVTIEMHTESAQCVYPPAGTIQVKAGTVLRWLNVNTADIITIHVGPNTNGCDHQADPGSPPGGAYPCTIIGGPSLSPFKWDCHSPGPMVNDRLIQVVP